MYRSANVLSGAVGLVHVMPLCPLGESARGKKPALFSALSLSTAGSRSWSARKTTNGIISSVASPSEPESNASKLWRLSAITLSICASRKRTSLSQAEDADVAEVPDVPDVPDVPVVPGAGSRFLPHPADTSHAPSKAGLAPLSQ